jgi:cell division protein FtsN
MKIRNAITILLCFLITGCAYKIQSVESESKVREFMGRAAALEEKEAYHQAAQIYGMVAEQYPSTSYHKLSVWKAAVLNMHPANPKKNYVAARSWLKVYLELPLSSDEKETATIYVSMINRINDLQAELSSMAEEKDRLLEITRKQSGELEADTERQKELEAELAHAWDELNKMKAVDVRMHRSKMGKSDIQPSQSTQKLPGKKTDKKKDKGKTAPQIRQHSLSKNRELYPYMVQVSSYKNKEDSIREAMILRDKGDSVCISYAHIAGKGNWYRVLVGFYQTPQEAKKAALGLKKREYHHAFVVRPPFTVELGFFSDDENLEKLKDYLISKGYSAYSLPNKSAENNTRLLVGAFWAEEEAATVIKELQKEGFKPNLVRR